MNYLDEALKEARKAYEKNEVPVGAVIVKNGKIISRAHNLKETKHLAIAHAEILAIEKACKKIQNWRLEDCEMYVTLKPCKMCKEVIKQSRIKHVYYGSKENIEDEIIKDNYTYVESGECSQILKEFFKKLREDKHN